MKSRESGFQSRTQNQKLIWRMPTVAPLLGKKKSYDEEPKGGVRLLLAVGEEKKAISQGSRVSRQKGKSASPRRGEKDPLGREGFEQGGDGGLRGRKWNKMKP